MAGGGLNMQTSGNPGGRGDKLPRLGRQSTPRQPSPSATVASCKLPTAPEQHLGEETQGGGSPRGDAAALTDEFQPNGRGLNPGWTES